VSEFAHCPCGKLVEFYSSLLDQGFCSDACYQKGMEDGETEQRDEVSEQEVHTQGLQIPREDN